jgi:hypothetical protein
VNQMDSVYPIYPLLTLFHFLFLSHKAVPPADDDDGGGKFPATVHGKQKRKHKEQVPVADSDSDSSEFSAESAEVETKRRKTLKKTVIADSSSESPESDKGVAHKSSKSQVGSKKKVDTIADSGSGMKTRHGAESTKAPANAPAKTRTSPRKKDQVDRLTDGWTESTILNADEGKKRKLISSIIVWITALAKHNKIDAKKMDLHDVPEFKKKDPTKWLGKDLRAFFLQQKMTDGYIKETAVNLYHSYCEL